MNYIYDILLNFNEAYYDFFEWGKKDDIKHFKKIPIIKINKNDYNKIVNYNFKIDLIILKKIANKAELWNKNNNMNYKYTLLISNGIDTIGIIFDELGNSIKRSSLIIDEELDISQTIKTVHIKKIDYILNSKIIYHLKTRKEMDEITFILNEVNKLSIINDKDKINYLYFECFNNLEENTKKALDIINKNINQERIINILYNILKIKKTSIK